VRAVEGATKGDDVRFGHFDDSAREYVIERPDTPLPWFNYLGAEGYFGLISNTAGGYSFYRDARLRRISRYRYNNVPFDFGGRYIYVRDDDSGEFWSPSWQPVRTPVDDYSCRHGMGYTIIGSARSGIRTDTRYFVPPGENLEIWDVIVANQRQTTAEVSLFGAIEFALWDAQDDMTNFQRNFNTGEVEVEGSVIYHKTEYRERRDHFAYFGCSETTAGFDTQREAFLGPYRGWDDPGAVRSGSATNSIANGWSPIGAHQVKLSLEPGESKRVVFLLGYAENPREDKFDPAGSTVINKRRVRKVIDRYTSVDRVDEAFRELAQEWERLLGLFQVETPDVATNRMINIWNAYQNMVTFNLSRSASFYESGVGRGLGFRDSNQDLLGFVHMAPARARQRVLDLAATQLPDGGAFHQYQPLTKRGNDAVGSNFNDDPLWLVLAVVAYVRETGDESILDEPVVYENTPGTERPLLDHLVRSLAFTLSRLGPNGLPLIGRADWNDCLNLNCFSDEPGQSFQTTTSKDGKTAESVMIAGLFCAAAGDMVDLARHIGRLDLAEVYAAARSSMLMTIEGPGWDGEWFVRAYDDFGHKVGSAECDEGKIFIESQGWSILGGAGLSNGMAQKALDSVARHLATDHGIVVNQPAFTAYHLELGEITSYPPGYKENASIFCHSNPWIMVAETKLGNGDRAFDYYRRICPAVREEISEVHRAEPYVYAQTIAGRDAPTHGEAKNSWLTGTAAWNYVAITQAILGIRPTFDGLEIQPVLPTSWDGYTATRVFRGTTYDIEVRRGARGSEPSLTVDGHVVDGSTVPLPGAGVARVGVHVTL
jgi:cellobiose phosphorylase